MVAVCGGWCLQPPEHPQQPGSEEGHGTGRGTVRVPHLHALVTARGHEGAAEGPGSGLPRQTPAAAGGDVASGGAIDLGGHGEGQAGGEWPWFGEGSKIVGSADCRRVVPKDVGVM